MSKRMEPFEKILSEAHDRCEASVQMMLVPKRIGERYKEMFREVIHYTLLAASREADGWTKRCDDAKRIPDVLHEIANAILKEDS